MSFKMENFTFGKTFNFIFPPRITFGVGTSSQLKNEIKSYSSKKSLIIIDKNIHEIGVANPIIEDLNSEKISFEIYDKIAAEPTTKSVKEVVEFARSGQYDSVVGIGGGSVIDTTKLLSGLLTNPGDLSKYVGVWEDNFVNPSAPCIIMPTTAGTGSEATSASLVINENKVKKYAFSKQLFPNLALVDPTLTLTCPPKQTAGSGMDALSHGLDSIITNTCNPLCKSIGLEITNLISSNIKEAYYNSNNIEARWHMSMAATLGGLNMDVATSGWPIHMIAEYIGPKYKIPHGIACAVTIPYILGFNIPALTDTIYEISQAMGIDTDGLSISESAENTIDAMIQLLQDLDLPTSLGGLDIPEDELLKDVKYLLSDLQNFYGYPTYGPKKYTEKNLAELLTNMVKGEPFPY